jgi:glycosyltransferase involved in cell wall biosynthesis
VNPSSGSSGPHIAFYSHYWPPGTFPNGVLTYTHQMRQALAGLGIRSSVFTSTSLGTCEGDVFVLDQRKGPLRAAVQRAHHFGCRLGLLRPPVPAIPNHFIEEVRAARKTHGLELLEMEESFGWAWEVERHCGIPVVIKLHGPWFLNGPARGIVQDEVFHRRLAIEGEAIASVAGVVAPARDMLDQVRHHYGIALDHAAVIPHPVEPAPHRWSRDRCRPREILFVGRFDRHKGGDTVIEAFARVAPAFPDARLLFVGPDRGLPTPAGTISLESFIRERIADPSIRERIECFGSREPEEIARLRVRASLTVVSSRYENWGFTTLEGLAAGSPLIVTATGGLPEIVQHDRNGLVCRPDDPADLARQIEALLSDPDRADRLAEQAYRDCSERYAPARIAEQSLEYYRETIRRYRSRRKP